MTVEKELEALGIDVPSLTEYYLRIHLEELRLQDKKTKRSIKNLYTQQIEGLKDTIATLIVEKKSKEHVLRSLEAE